MVNFSFDIEVKGMEKLLDVTGDGGKKAVNDAVMDAMHDITSNTYLDVFQRTPVFTGQLRGSLGFNIFVRGVGEGFVGEAMIFGLAPHTSFVEFGTGDRGLSPPASGSPIRPIGNNPMVFFWKGRWHRKFEVHGQRPQLMFSRAVDNLMARLQPTYEVKLETHLKRMEG